MAPITPRLTPSNTDISDLLELVDKEYYLESLTKQEKIFVESLISTKSITTSAGLAGLSKLRAKKLMKSQKIQLALKLYRELQDNRAAVTKDYFVKVLKDIIDNKKTKPNEKVNALQLLAKLTGHLRDVKEDNKQMVVFNINEGNSKPAEKNITVDIPVNKNNNKE